MDEMIAQLEKHLPAVLGCEQNEHYSIDMHEWHQP